MANFKLLPTRLRRMTEIERAYLGGAIDADGSVGVRKRNNAATDRPYATFYSIKLEPISAFLRATGVGSITYSDRKGMKYGDINIWVWRIDRVLEVIDLAEQCYPYSLKCQKVLRELYA